VRVAERTSDGASVERLLVGIAAAIVILAGLRAASAVLIPLLVALVITAIVAPAQIWLARRTERPGAAFVIVALGVTAVVAGLVWLTYVALSDFLHSLPAYGPALDQLASQLYASAEGAGFHLSALAPMPRPDVLLPGIGDATRSILADVTGGWILVLALTLFMLYEARTFRAKLAVALHGRDAQRERIETFGRQLGQSMGVLTLANLMVAVGNGLILLALGVPNALLWASLSFLLNYIPDVGFIVSVIPPTVATLLHHGALPAFAVLVGFIVLNAIIDEIVYPRMLGSQLDLAPFWTLTSLVFWGWLLGVAGAILAIPLTMLVKLVLDSFDATRPVGMLLTAGRTLGDSAEEP
jgi:AI-2 transport protein TqsA